MEETPHDCEPPHEQGKLIRLPNRWVPSDGVEPLNGPGEQQGSSNEASGWPAVEAGEFWESGDTQEFVGVAAGPSAETTIVDDPDVPPIAAADAPKSSSEGNRRSYRPWSAGRNAWPRAAAIASAAVCLLVGGGIAVSTGGHPDRQSEGHASLGAAHQQTSAESAADSMALPKFHDRQTASASRHTSRRVLSRTERRQNTRRSHPSSSGLAVPVHYVTPVSTPATSSQAAAQPTSYPTSQPVASSPPSATAANQPAVSSQPAGPSGPGYVIGSNCNPKCR